MAKEKSAIAEKPKKVKEEITDKKEENKLSQTTTQQNQLAQKSGSSVWLKVCCYCGILFLIFVLIAIWWTISFFGGPKAAWIFLREGF